MTAMNETTNDDLSTFGKARATIQESPLNAEELRLINAYWRTTLYLSVGMIYLRNKSAAARTAEAGRYKEEVVGALGFRSRS